MINQNNSKTKGLTSFVTFKMARVQNKLNAQATHLLKSGCGLTLVEWRIILLLRLHVGASMSKLAREVQMDKGQLSRKVNAMVAKGLINTAPDEIDQRKQNLSLTATAQSIYEQMIPTMLKRQDRLVADVSEADLEVFFRVLASIEGVSEMRNGL